VSDKPHYGRIANWTKVHLTDHGLGYIVYGTFLDHPRWKGVDGIHTSAIVTHDEATGEIETRNSRYTLVGKESRE
jgi:hypothetical protein